MRKKWNVVILIVVIIALSYADHQVCYLPSTKCGHSDNVTTCDGQISSTLEVNCRFNLTLNESSTISYLWWKDENVLNQSSKAIIFDPFSPLDAGSYRCEAHDDSDHVIFCGQIQLKVVSTRPTAPKNCTINRNGNHNCSCTQYIYPTAGCEQLITAYVNGYPEPNIIWLFNETVATNDTQNLFTVKEDNKSAVVDLQLWSMDEYKDMISILAHNEFGSLMICFYPYFQKYEDKDYLHIPFSNSLVKPLQLIRGNNNVTVKNCSLPIPIGTFYMCFSKNLSGLEKIEVDDQQCCYCSREGANYCMKRFPNWHLDYMDSSPKCYLTLMTVNDSDNGYYQCRISSDDKICKFRYGCITDLSVSNPSPGDHKSSTSISTWIHSHISITCVITSIIVIIIIVGVISISTYCICKKKRSRTGFGYRASMTSSDRREEEAPLLQDPAPTEQPDQQENGDINGSAESGSTAQAKSRGTTQETNANGRSELVPSSGHAKKPKISIMYDEVTSTVKWVDGTLKIKLATLGFELAPKIAGRPRISEVTRLIDDNCKIIMIFTKQKISKQLSTDLIYALSKQDISKTAVIPILLNCKVEDLSDEVQSYLLPYTSLKHDELDDHLLQSLTA